MHDDRHEYCGKCGNDVEYGHPCPGDEQTQVARVVKHAGLEKVIEWATKAKEAVDKAEVQRKRSELEYRISQLRNKILEADVSKIKLKELEEELKDLG